MAFDRKAYMDEYNRKYYQDHTEQIKEKVWQWRQTERGRELHNQANRRSSLRHPETKREWKRKHQAELNEAARELYHSNIERSRKMHNARARAQRVPLAQFCELCPDNCRRAATERHHPDHEFWEIYVSVCKTCHRWIEKGCD